MSECLIYQIKPGKTTVRDTFGCARDRIQTHIPFVSCPLGR
jgi:hypothetical protein